MTITIAPGPSTYHISASNTTASNAGLRGSATVSQGITITGSLDVLTNSGTILAGNSNSGNAYKGAVVVQTGAGDIVSNQVGGYLHGGFTEVPGVNFALISGTVVNAGLIASGQGPSGGSANGVDMSGGGVVTNLSTGTINGGGVYFSGGTGTVINSGKILGDSVYGGVDLARGGVVTNLAGTIASNGAAYGVQITGGAATVTNAGTITGGSSAGYAVLLATGYSNRVIVDPGAVFIGRITGGTPSLATMELASGASTGTITGFGSQYANFGTLTFDASSQWLVKAGTAALATPIINGFASGETIDLNGFVAVSETFASNALVLTNSATAHTTLHVTGSLTTGNFAIASDGSGGTDITEGNTMTLGHTITGTYTATVTLTSPANDPLTVLSTGKVVPVGTTGANGGLYAKGGGSTAWTITNSGLINDGTNGEGIRLGRETTFVGASVVTNTTGGTIIGKYGIDMYNGTASPGVVVNQAGGTIIATTESGVYLYGAGTVTNYGVILAGTTVSSQIGVSMERGGTVINNAGGTISGEEGVDLYAFGTVTNAGTIEAGNTATGVAVGFSGNTAANRLIADPGAVFLGLVQGGLGTLELASAASAGTLSGFGTSITNFNTLTFDTGARWTATGNSLSDGLGTIAITGFTLGDTINLTGFVATSETFAGNLLTLTNAATAHATLHIQGSFTSGNFFLASDGAGGVDITEGAAVLGHTITGTYATSLTLTSAANSNPFTIAATSKILTSLGGHPGTLTTPPVPGAALYGVSGTPWTITNYGTISNTSVYEAEAIELGNNRGLYVGSAVVINKSGGLITGAENGIRALGGISVTNAAGGTISAGQDFAISLYGGKGTVVNYGLVLSQGLSGGPGISVYLYDGGTITNHAGGTISGHVGVQFGSGQYTAPGTTNAGGAVFAATLNNAGTITGTNGAVVFYTNAANRLITNPGAVFTGSVDVGTGILELASGATTGTISNLGSNFFNFATLQFDPGARWLASGPAVLLANYPMTGFATGDTIDLTGFVAVSRTFASNALVLTNAATAHTTLHIVGSLATANFVIASDGTGGTDINFTSGASALVYGQTIDQAGTVVTSETVTAGTMTLFNGGSPVGTIAVGTTLSTGDFTLRFDGTSGTDVIVSSVFGTYATGVTLLTNPTTIDATGHVSSATTASRAVIGPAGTAWAVTNQGTVSNSGTGGFGIYLTAGGTVVNAGEITLSGTAIGGSGIYVKGAGSVTNLSAGTITPVGGSGISLYGGGNVVNNGTIRAGFYGITGRALTTVTNTGVILGTGTARSGVQLNAGGYVTNSGGGTIIATGGVAVANNNAGTVVNSGTIEGTASRAIYLHSGTVVNSGVLLAAGAGPGTLNRGVYIYGNGYVTNLSGGTITGSAGVFLGGGYTDTLDNSGTIVATGSLAVSFNGGGTHRLIDHPGAVFTGGIYGGTFASATMELASGASTGTVTGFGTTITNFNTLMFDPGAQWLVAGNASFIGLGTLGISGFTTGNTIDLTGFVATSETFASNALVLTNAATAHTTLHVQGTFTSGDFAIAGDGATGTDITFGVSITPLAYGHTTDLTGIVATSETVAAGVMTLQNAGGTTVGTINVGTSLSTGDFMLTSDGSAGTDVILSTVFGTYASGVTLLTNPTTIASTAAISGSLSNATGVYGPPGTAWTLTNQGQISETALAKYGISFASPGTVFNTATGTITSDRYALMLNAGGFVSNQTDGVISGNDGVLAETGPITVANSGVIEGGATVSGEIGVYFGAGGLVTNQLGGTIAGYEAIEALRDVATVVNFGQIAGNTTASGGVGVNLSAGGFVTNQSSGTIAGYDGVSISGAPGTVDNLGHISALAGSYGQDGIYLADGGVVINGQSGTTVSPAFIEGYRSGIFSASTNASTVTNFGSILGFPGGVGIHLATGTVINGPSGATGATIYGGYRAAVAISQAGVIVNYGTITAPGRTGEPVVFYGVDLGGAGSIGNLGTRSLIYGYMGLYAQLNDTVTNAGTISGRDANAAAIVFGGGINRLIIDPGARFIGTVSGGGSVTETLGGGPTIIGTANGIGTTTMELASAAGTGTIAGVGVSITNFASLVFDPGARWSVQGNDLAGGLGTLGIAGFSYGDTIDLTGFAAVSRTFGSNALVLTDGGGAHATLAIQGSFSSGNFTIASDGDGGTDIVFGTVPLVYGETIDETGIVATSETVTAGTMTLFDGGSPVGTIVVGASLNSGDFTLRADGAGGTDVIVSTVFGAYVNGVTLLTNPTTIAGTANVANAAANGDAVTGPVGTTWTVTNLGLVTESGTHGIGIDLKASGTVVNAGTISSTIGREAIYVAGAGAITNLSAGTILAPAAYGIRIIGAGTVNNAGTVAGGGAAIAGNGLLTVTNTGILTGTAPKSSGVNLRIGGFVTNSAGGTINGSDYGVASGGTLTVNNSGVILGTAAGGIYLDHGTVANAGLISGPIGIYLYGTGVVTNLSTGTITGALGVGFGAGTLIDSGTIIGAGGTAVSFGTGSNSVVLLPGNLVIQGTVDGGPGGSVLEFASAASIGTLTGTGADFVRFATATIDTGANWVLAGGNAIGSGVSLTNSGTLTDTGTLLNSGTLTGNKLRLDGGALTNQAGGVITATYIFGINAGGIDTVVNQGTITNSANSAIYLAAAGNVSNAAGAVITAYGAAVKLHGPGATLSNLGQIISTAPESSGYGVYLRNGGLITNGQAGSGTSTSTAFITGYYGLTFKTGDVVNAYGTLINFGSVIGTGIDAEGALLSNAGTVFNGQSGATAALIEGGRYGVSSGAGPVANYATIIATGTLEGEYGIAIQGTGSVGNLGPAALIEGYAGVLIGTDGTVTNAGTIKSTLGLSGVAVRFIDGDSRLIDVPGAVFVGSVYGGSGGTAVMELASAASAGTISGFGTSITNFTSLVFDTGARWTVTGNDAANGLGTLHVSGFAAGDTIDLLGFVAVSETFASNILTLTDGDEDHDTVTIPGTFTTANFHFNPDGVGGTDLTFITPPVIVAGGSATFLGGGVPVVLDGGLTVTDSESATLVGGTISVGTGFLAGDTLNFVSQGGISGVFDSGTGALTLSGTASVANYQTALASITYSFTPSNNDPTGGGTDTSRVIDWMVNDGTSSSPGATSVLDVTRVAPSIVTGGTVSFSGGGAAVALDPTLTVLDPDSGGLLSSGTVSVVGFIPGDILSANTTGLAIIQAFNGTTGVLTLSGGDTLADYQAALRSVQYSFNPANGDPTGGGSHAARVIDWSINDGVAGSNTGTSSLIDVHVAPTVTASGTVTFTVGGPSVVLDGGIAIGDPDSGGNLVGGTISISSDFHAGDMLNFVNQNGITGSYNSTNGQLTLGGTATTGNYTTALASITYSSSAGDPTNDGDDPIRAISWFVSDGVTGSAVPTTTVDIAFAPPVIAGAAAGQTTTDEATLSPFSALSIHELASGQTETVTITLSNAANGTLSNVAGGSYDSKAGVYSVAGTDAVVSAAVDGLVFTPTAHQVAPGGSVTTTFTIKTTDTAGGTASDSTTTVAATAVNDPPVIAGADGGQSTTDEATLSPFSEVSIGDVDFGQTETLTVTLSNPLNGTLSNVAGGSYDSKLGVYSVTGTGAAVSSAIDGLVFTPTTHQVAPGASVTTTFTIKATDTAGGTTSNATTTVAATAVNDPPVIAGAVSGQTTTDEAPLSPFAEVSISDVDFGQSETVTVTLSNPLDGALSNLAGGSYDSKLGLYTISGTGAAVTGAVDGLVFTPTAHQVAPGASITTTFTIKTTDSAEGTASNSTTTVGATAVDDPPVIAGAVSGQTTTDEAPLSPFATVSIHDVDFGQAETVTVTLSNPVDGTISNPAGGSYDSKFGVYTVSGTDSVVTSAIDGLVFTPTAHQVVPGASIATTFTIKATDTAGGTASDTTTTVAATAVNDPPVITGADPGQTTTDAATLSPFVEVSIGDVDFGQTETVTITLSTAANGTLSNVAGGAYDSKLGVYTVSGTDAAVSTAIDGLVFTPTAHQVAPGASVTTTFTIKTTDTAGGTASNATTTVAATAVNDAPVIAGAVSGQTTTDEATLSPFAAVSIHDVDFGQTETVTVTLSSPVNGALSNVAGGSYNAKLGVYTVSGTDAAVTSAVDGLVFTPTAHQVVPGASVTTIFTIKTTDTAGRTAGNAATTVAATAVNDPPVITGAASGQTTTDEAALAPFAAISIGDIDFGQTETVTIALSNPLNGTLSNVAGGTFDSKLGVYTVSGTDAAVTGAIDGLVFTPTAHQVAPGGSVTTTFSIKTTDTAGGTSDATTTVAATAVNDPPVIAGATGGQTTTDEATLSPFSEVSIGDFDFGQTETLTVTLSNPLNGALSNVAGGSYDSKLGVYSVTGTGAAVSSAIDGLVFTPTAHQVAPGASVTTTFTIKATDTAGGTTSNATTTVAATAVNDPPVIAGAAPGQTTTDEATLTPFVEVSISDVDFAQSETVTVTLSNPLNGALSNVAGGSYDSKLGVYSVTGTGAAVSSAIDGLVFTPTAHQVTPGASVTTTFTIKTTDTAGGTASNNTTTVGATAANDPPVIAGAVSGQSTTDEAPLSPFTTVSIHDVDFGQAETVTVTLSNPLDGTISNPAGGSYDSKLGVYTVSGTDAAVTSAIDGLVFNPTAHQVAPGASVATIFTIKTTDSAGGTASDNTTTVAATAVNDPPVIFGAVSGQTTTDTVALSPFTEVSIGDVDIGQTETVTVRLSNPANGKLTNLGGGDFESGPGIYSVTGTDAVVRAAVDNLVFVPTAHQVAPGASVTTIFTIKTTDTAGGTASNATTTVAATAVNDPPVIAGAVSGQTTTDEATLSPFAEVSIHDVDFGQTETVTITLSNPLNGALSNLAGGAYNGSTGVFSVTGTDAAVTSAIDGLVFTPTAHQVVPSASVTTIFTIKTTDTAGGTAANAATTVAATAVNDPPVIAGAASGQTTTDEAALAPFSSVSISDAASGQSETVTVTLSNSANGTLSNLAGGTYDSKAGVYTVSGTDAAVSSALDGLIFTPAMHQVPAGNSVTTTFTIKATDTAGATSSNGTTTVVATAVNDPPVISGTVADQGVPNETPSNPFATVTVTDPDFFPLETITVTLSAPGNGTLSSLSTGTYNASTGVYSVTGTPATDTAALRALVFTPTEQPNTDAVTTGFAIASGIGGDTDTTTNVTSVQQILGLAAVPLNQIAISVSPGGTGFATAVSGDTNEAVVIDPAERATYSVPSGYQALFLGGTADATLSDAGGGNALLVANSGNDQLIANAPNDTLVAGSGSDSLVGGAFDSIVIGGSGPATVFAGSGVMHVFEGSGPIVFGGNGNTGSTVLGGSGPNASPLMANLTGQNQTVSVGSSASTITAAGSGDAVIGGSSTLNVTVSGSADTIQAGSGASTVVSGGSGNQITGGSGPLVVAESGTGNTISGGAGAATVTASTATFVAGGSGGLTFVGGLGTATVVGGTGATTVTAGAGGLIFDAGTSDNATVNSGSGTVSIFGAPGTTVNLVGTVGGSASQPDYAVAGSGSETLNAAGSAASVWLSVNTTVTSSAATLIAGSGNDTLIAGSAPGATTMTGGTGSDAFVFFRQAVGGAHDVINDFTPGDAVYIEGYGAGSAGALLNASSVSANGLTLTLSDGTTVTFSNLTDQHALDGRVQYG